MINDPSTFTTIHIICSATGLIGGSLGIVAFVYIYQKHVFIEFLVKHFTNAMKRKRKWTK